MVDALAGVCWTAWCKAEIRNVYFMHITNHGHMGCKIIYHGYNNDKQPKHESNVQRRYSMIVHFS